MKAIAAYCRAIALELPGFQELLASLPPGSMRVIAGQLAAGSNARTNSSVVINWCAYVAALISCAA